MIFIRVAFIRLHPETDRTTTVSGEDKSHQAVPTNRESCSFTAQEITVQPLYVKIIKIAIISVKDKLNRK